MRMARAIWISLATLTSRLLGLIRDQLFAALVGANAWSDAFVAAFRIPNLLRDLFAEGALSSAFVPAFAETRQNRGAFEAFRLANLVMGLILLVVGALVLLGVLLAGPLVSLVAPGFEGEQDRLTVELTRLLMPFLLLVSLSAAVMGMLNAQGRFTAPALAPALFNVASIAVGAGLWWAGLDARSAVVGWSLGTLLGGLVQLLAQLPSLRATGFRPRPRLAGAWQDPGVRRIAMLMGAAVVGLSATQVNIVVNTIFASQEAKAVTWLNFAFRLMQFPLGVFGVAVATVAGAGVAEKAAARDLPAVRETVGQAMRLVAFLNVPSAAGLVVLASPIIAVIFEHGRFGAEDTQGTAQALVFYALGLYCYSGVKVLAPAFYALDQARIPLWGSVLGMTSNVALNLLLHPVLGYRGVALGTSLAAAANFGVLAVAWKVRHGGFGAKGLLPQLARVAASTAALGLAAWGAHRQLLGVAPAAGLGRQALLCFGPIAAGAAVYLAAARLLRVEELGDLWGALRRRKG